MALRPLLALLLTTGLLPAQGIISTVAGGGDQILGDGGPATRAQLNSPWDVVVDKQNNIYFTDSLNHRIRKVTPAGTLSTIAGTGTPGFNGDNQPAVQAQIWLPRGLDIDAQGNLYFADYNNRRIRKIDTSGIITTIAGNGLIGAAADDQPATQASLFNAVDVAVGTDGSVYIAETNGNRIRVVGPGGLLKTVVGTGQPSSAGDGGDAKNATVLLPVAVAIDPSNGTLLISESNKIRRAVIGGNITTIAGIFGGGFSGDNGPATAAVLANPFGLIVAPNGVIYIADTGNDRVRRIGLDGIITTFAGGTSNPQVPQQGDGQAANLALVRFPIGLFLDTQGSLFIAEANGLKIRKVMAEVSGPSIDAGGIVNASGYQITLAPGTVFTIFGKNLGPASIATASAPNYPSELGGTSVTFTPANGGATVTAKLIYSVSTQVAGLIPSNIVPGSGTFAVRVTYNGQTSNAQNVILVTRSFGIAAANSAGTGPAQVTIGNVNGGLSLVRTTSGSLTFGGYTWVLTPAHPGDTLVLWGTGGGADLANDAGGSSGDQTAAGAFQVFVAGRPIVPSYAGTSFGYPGLWQINFTLPADIATRCEVSLQVRAAAIFSNSVNLAIAPPGQTSCVP